MPATVVYLPKPAEIDNSARQLQVVPSGAGDLTNQLPASAGVVEAARGPVQPRALEESVEHPGGKAERGESRIGLDDRENLLGMARGKGREPCAQCGWPACRGSQWRTHGVGDMGSRRWNAKAGVRRMPQRLNPRAARGEHAARNALADFDGAILVVGFETARRDDLDLSAFVVPARQ